MELRNIIVGCVILFCSQFISAQNEVDSCEIRKEGIYVAKLNETTNIYLRFLGKDSVVSSSSTMSIDEAMEYINGEHSNLILSGKFQNKNCYVSLNAKGKMGKVKMDGVVAFDKLALTITNKTDNTYQDFIFIFHPLKLD